MLKVPRDTVFDNAKTTEMALLSIYNVIEIVRVEYDCQLCTTEVRKYRDRQKGKDDGPRPTPEVYSANYMTHKLN